MNKRCVALTEEQYKEAVSLLRTGFELNGTKVKPNNRIATVAVLQSTLGLRLGDCLSLRMRKWENLLTILILKDMEATAR